MRYPVEDRQDRPRSLRALCGCAAEGKGDKGSRSVAVGRADPLGYRESHTNHPYPAYSSPDRQIPPQPNGPTKTTDLQSIKETWLHSYPRGNHGATGDTSLAEELNIFFTRFEVAATESDPSPPTSSNSHILTVKEHDHTALTLKHLMSCRRQRRSSCSQLTAHGTLQPDVTGSPKHLENVKP
ncbi:hypothetical protein NHX12_001400 [Muraenolepis orangiensis]|uniref:Uncharacterized protein n=1 Tax=Muraenolepis orangiensis TaxID=630683 RepID=A0A9Q0E0N0_9TELE|nr:hypothetical protein NHX12_001400 [Muraenolepis orangiensis]